MRPRLQQVRCTNSTDYEPDGGLPKSIFADSIAESLRAIVVMSPQDNTVVTPHLPLASTLLKPLFRLPTRFAAQRWTTSGASIRTWELRKSKSDHFFESRRILKTVTTINIGTSTTSYSMSTSRKHPNRQRRF
jgi:hypothetical protein